MSSHTIVDTDSTQTLAGKTLSAPVINGGTCGADPTAALGIATKQYVDAKVIIPTGLQLPYGGSAAPAGWLACDGSAVSRTTYSALFAVVGTKYGVGDGSTTFNVPNKSGRASIGAGQGAGLTNRVQGTRGGEEAHLLTSAESGLPAHTHPQEGDTALLGSGSSWTGPGSSFGQGGTTGNNATQNAAQAHNTMMPYEVDLWIIKT